MAFRRRNMVPRIPNCQSRIRRPTTSAGAGRSWALLAWAVCGSLAAAGADWPTCQCRNDRNAATAERLSLPLSAAWVHQARYAPQPAWPPPAKQDFYHGAFELAPRVDFDCAYHVVVAGDCLFYGSAADHAVHCLAAATGEERWAFSTEGPVRLAPSLCDDKLYFGSDDGCVYCLAAADGRLLWRYRPGPADRRLPGNGRVISLWPVRTGLIVEKGVVYGGAGLFPEHGVYLFALDANSGSRLWQRTIGQPAQGYLATDGKVLWAAGGRAGAIGVRLRDGREVGSADAYGTYFVAAGGHFFCEDSQRQRQLQLLPGLTHPAHFIALSGEIAYLQGPREMAAVTLAPYLQRGAELVKLQQRETTLMEKLQKLGDGRPDAQAPLRGELDALRRAIAAAQREMRDGFHLWKREDSRGLLLRARRRHAGVRPPGARHRGTGRRRPRNMGGGGFGQGLRVGRRPGAALRLHRRRPHLLFPIGPGRADRRSAAAARPLAVSARPSGCCLRPGGRGDCQGIGQRQGLCPRARLRRGAAGRRAGAAYGNGGCGRGNGRGEGGPSARGPGAGRPGRPRRRASRRRPATALSQLLRQPDRLRRGRRLRRVARCAGRGPSPVAPLRGRGDVRRRPQRPE